MIAKSNVGQGTIATRFLVTTDDGFINCPGDELLFGDINVDASSFKPFM